MNTQQNLSILVEQSETVKSLCYDMERYLTPKQRIDNMKTLKYHIKQLSSYLEIVYDDSIRENETWK